MVSLVIVTAGVSITSLLTVRNRVGKHVYDELVMALNNSAATFQTVQHDKEAAAQRTVQLIGNVPALKAMMTTGDAATIQDASADIWRRAGTDLLALASPSGKLLAVHGVGEPAPTRDVEVLFAESMGRAQDWWFVDGQLYEVFLGPVSSGSASDAHSLGVLAIGFVISPAVAEQAARIAEGQVAFRFGDRQIVSTLRDAQAKELDRYQFVRAGEERAMELELGGERYVGTEVRLGSEGDRSVQVVMLKSYDRATSFLNTLNRLSVGIGVTAATLCTVFVFFILHTFTRPLGELVVGVRALAKGDFSYPLNTRGTDEVAEVTRAFHAMRQSLQESQSRTVNAARMEAVGQLAGGVAHDFNNLVTIIKGYTELLLMYAKDDDPITGYCQQIQKAGDRAASVTRQLLAFSRRQVIQPQVIDLAAVVTNMTKMLKVLIGEDIEVKVVAENELRRVLADPGQVEQVLLNLAVNARDAMPKGGKLTLETINVEIGREDIPDDVCGVQPGRFVRLAVSDTGSGISPENLERIFQPFFTTKEVGKGTGLGLAIVFGIVKQTGGFLRVASELGKGTTFQIFFPETLKKPDLQMTACPAWKLEPRGEGTILVVEDEEALRAIARDALRLQGYTVLEASQGVEGLAVFQRTGGNVDLVLSDVVMPQLNGLDMAERMRKVRPELKVLFMSGYSDRIDEVTSPAFDFLPKPFTPDQLLKGVRAILALGPELPSVVSATSPSS